MEKIILHIDMDAFFASIEQRDDPALKDKPVIVGGSGGSKGVVSAASYKAREFGVHSAMSIYEARQLCPQAVFIKGNYRKYTQASVRMLKICHTISPHVQPISIDEAFIDISGSIPYYRSKIQIAQKLKNEIMEQLKLTCSIGIAPNRLLAKIATELHKPAGITIIDKENLNKILKQLNVGKIPGIGKKTTEILKKMGIYKAMDLILVPRNLLIKRFGGIGKILTLLAGGVEEDNYSQKQKRESKKNKSISNEITLKQPTDNIAELQRILIKLTHKVAYRLRKKNASAQTITLKIKYSNFVVKTLNKTLNTTINYEPEIYKNIMELFRKIDLSFRKVRLLGIRLSNLVFPEDPIQMNIFSVNKKKYARICTALDKLKKKYGENIINIGK